MDQVLLNLVVNARDAMPCGGAISIETSNVEVGPSEACALSLAPGAYVALVVADTGIGMDEETRARIFEPFFTTKEVGKGTGLGLATVFGIVKKSGGAIAVESQPGHGATFRVYFPARRGAVASVPSERPSSVDLRGAETILVVEDEDAVRKVVRRALAARGYVVVEASNATAALEKFDGMPGLDLVLTDLVMPDVDGATMAAEMRARRPGVRILFMSGFEDHPSMKGAALAPSDVLVRKPFSVQGLLGAVREALANRGASPAVGAAGG